MTGRLIELGPSRGPYLPPRRRDVPPATARRLEGWLRDCLRLGPEVPIGMHEWVSNDPRDVPHRLVIDIPARRLRLLVKARAERVSRQDIVRAAGPRSTAGAQPAWP